MTELKDLNAYDAAKAAINGYKKYKVGGYKNFKLKTDTYGQHRNDVCFGCLATLAIQYACDCDFTTDNISSTLGRSRGAGVRIFDLDRFETAIDGLRVDGGRKFLSYYELEYDRENLSITPHTLNIETDDSLAMKLLDLWIEKNKDILKTGQLNLKLRG